MFSVSTGSKSLDSVLGGNTLKKPTNLYWRRSWYGTFCCGIGIVGIGRRLEGEMSLFICFMGRVLDTDG